MAFGMFSAQASPIAIDFGSSSVKMLQIGGGEKPALISAAEAPVPESVRGEPERVFTFFEEWVPKFLRDGKFKGKRAVISLPAGLAFTQHMQIAETGAAREEAIKNQLQIQMGVSPDAVVVRSVEVCPVTRDGQARTEMICFAIGKDAVMRYIELLRKCKLEVVGVHTEMMAMVQAFDHLYRREEDEALATLFVDIGWGGTRAVVTHGKKMVFARYFGMGGRSFDQLISSTAKCDIAAARTHRLALQASLDQAKLHRSASEQPLQRGNGVADRDTNGGGTAMLVAPTRVSIPLERRVGAPSAGLSAPLPGAEGAVNVEVAELLETMSDELQMSLRYYRGLFSNKQLNRAVFVGGESRQAWLCQHLVNSLNIPVQLGNPLARLDLTQSPTATGVDLRQPQPGWAVACGLCFAPTDL